MSGLLYYLPECTRAIKVADLGKIGLGYAFDSRLVPREVQRGPGGDRGVVVADPDRLPEHLLGFWPEKQTWLKIPGLPDGKEAWVGRHNDQPVRPPDLVRESVLPGHFVTLADGNDWLVPIARGINADGDEPFGYPNLPQTVGVDDAGAWTQGGVVPKYRRLWEIATAWWDAFAAAGPGPDDVDDVVVDDKRKVTIEFDFPGVNDAALYALATNYRVGKAEVALLGLFDDRSTVEVLEALIDWPTVQAWIKKKVSETSTPDGSSTDAGPEASIPDTGQPSPTSGP